MRRTLRICCLLAAVIASVAMIQPAAVADANIGIGISSSTSTPQSTMGTRFELHRQESLLAMWTTTMGTMPVIYSSDSLTLSVLGDFIGYRNIGEVTFVATSKDGRVFEWKASLGDIALQTYTASINTQDLPLGTYNCSWLVKSRDKTKTVDFFGAAELNLMKNRDTATGNYLLVQSSPPNEASMNDQEAYGYLRGFAPGWATPDPGYIAQTKMLESMAAQQQQQQQQQQDQQPAQQPVQQPVQQPTRSIQEESPSAPAVQTPPPVSPVPEPPAPEYRYVLTLNNGGRHQSVEVVMDELLSCGDELVVERDGEIVTVARITRVEHSKVSATLIDGGFLDPSDDRDASITVNHEEGNNR